MTRLAVRTAHLDRRGDLAALVPTTRGLAWLHGGDGLVGIGEAARFEPGPGPDRFARAAAMFDEFVRAANVERDDVDLPGGGIVGIGSFTFDDRAQGSVLVVPEVLLEVRGDRVRFTTILEDGAPTPDPPRPISLSDTPRDRVRYAGSSVPDVLWLEGVAEATRRIRLGALEKVVLARDHAVWSKTPFEVPRLVRHLVTHFPRCYTFVCDGLVGATPELLVRRQGDEITSLVLAGSARRDPDPAVDDTIGKSLLASDKDWSEHEIAVRSVRDVLAERCANVTHDREPSLLKLENVQHLATRFSCAATGTTGALELAGALHPTAAVGGLPRAEAVDLIRELEGMDRGRYSGPVGWIDAAGNGEWGIALRCAQMSGARARLFAGAGIVAQSLPENELEETRLKLQAMQDACNA